MIAIRRVTPRRRFATAYGAVLILVGILAFISTPLAAQSGGGKSSNSKSSGNDKKDDDRDKDKGRGNNGRKDDDGVKFVGYFSGTANGCPNGGAIYATEAGNSYICNGTNGANGTNGTNGIDGTNGTNGTSVTFVGYFTEDAHGCASGGAIFSTVDGETYVCNGATGPQGVKGDQGAAGPGNVAATSAFTGGNLIGATCTNVGGANAITLPGDSPAGQVIATAKVIVRVNHTSGAADRGYVTFGTSAADCGSSDAYRSYFRVPSGNPLAATYNGSNPATSEFYEFTVFVQVPFNVVAGTGDPHLHSYFLNAIMLPLPNNTAPAINDWIQDGNVSLEFHTN